MNEFIHLITSNPTWPIIPVGVLFASWLGLSLQLCFADADHARRSFGRGLRRFMAVPDAELDREIESSLHSIAFLVLAIVPAFVVAAFFTIAMGLGKGIHDANVSSLTRLMLYGAVVVPFAFGVPTFLNWSVGNLLARSLDRRFARRMAN